MKLRLLPKAPAHFTLLNRFGLLLAFTLSVKAFAHPTFIRNGYRSCTTCHETSLGGGLLTAYGQGIAGWKVDEKTEKRKMMHGGQGRFLTTRRAKQPTDSFLMQADYQNRISFSRSIRMLFTGGLRPNRSGAIAGLGPKRIWDRWVVRQWVVGWKNPEESENQLYVTLGREFLPMGIFSEDHILAYRRRLKRGPDDFVTQLRIDRMSESTDISLFAFGPSFEERTQNREWGGGTRLEHSIGQNQTLGGLIQTSRSSVISRSFIELFTRIGITPYAGVLATTSVAKRAILGNDPGRFYQFLGYLSPFINIKDRVEVLLPFEWIRVGKPFREKGYRIGSTARLAITPHFALQVDHRYQAMERNKWNEYSGQLIARF